MTARARVRNGMYLQFVYSRITPPQSLIRMVTAMNERINQRRTIIRDIINDTIHTQNLSPSSGLCRELLY